MQLLYGDMCVCVQHRMPVVNVCECEFEQIFCYLFLQLLLTLEWSFRPTWYFGFGTLKSMHLWSKHAWHVFTAFSHMPKWIPFCMYDERTALKPPKTHRKQQQQQQQLIESHFSSFDFWLVCRVAVKLINFFVASFLSCALLNGNIEHKCSNNIILKSVLDTRMNHSHSPVHINRFWMMIRYSYPFYPLTG